MYVRRYLNPIIIYFYSWRMVLFSIITGVLAIVIYDVLGYKWVAIPWLPVSLIGTATAFFVGFKNNQSYDRSWEARKIWGAITNHSRSFGAALRAFSVNQSHSTALREEADQELKAIIYRHIGWLYALKDAMAQRTSWEHEDRASKRQRTALRKKLETFDQEIVRYLSQEEVEWLDSKKNKAAQLLDRQSQHIAGLRENGTIDAYQHVELQRMISSFYDEQGKSERIKNTPFPRQYATTSILFIYIFMLLLPFGLLTEFIELGEKYLLLLIPFNMVVSWVFMFMEYTGDISENPFEGLLHDVPVASIVRNIEIDLRDMLGEDDLPEKVKPFFGALF